jgi:type I restriction enzyme S subunit
MIGRFLFRAFSADRIADQFRVAANGITRFGIGKDDITGALFPVPPLEEQLRIADYLDRKTAGIDALIAGSDSYGGGHAKGLLARMRDLLREYRQALISAAVTGRIPVEEMIPKSDEGEQA